MNRTGTSKFLIGGNISRGVIVEGGHGGRDFIREDCECRDEKGGSFACGVWVTMKDTLSMVNI